MATYTGTESDDTVTGGVAGGDTLQGLGGNDTLIGRSRDVLDGGPGIDTASYALASGPVQAFLSGGSPTGDAFGVVYISIENLTGSPFDDYLSGNGLNNTIHGGDGNDVLFGLGAAGSVTQLFGDNGIDTLVGGAGIDIMDGGAGENTVSYILSSAGVTVSLANQGLNKGDAQGDTYVNLQDVIGSNSDDTIYGSAGGALNQLQGQRGNDTIFGGGAAYTVLIGGVGADALHGGTGGNEIDYETAASGVVVNLLNPGQNTGDAAGDTYAGFVNPDLAGSPYDDVLFGDNGNNVIIGDPAVAVYGRFGNDQLFGGGGNDTLQGGPGADFLVGGPGADYLLGGDGSDLFAYFATSDSVPGSVDVIGDFVIGADKIDISAVKPTGIGIVQSGATGLIFIDTPGGTMEIGVSAHIGGSDLVTGGSGVTLLGDNSASILIGTAYNDVIFGNGGDDIIQGGAGADVLFGGAGSDQFRFLAADSNASGADLIADFETGIDKIDLAIVSATAIAIIDQGANSLIFANTPTGQIQFNTLGTVQGYDILSKVGVTIQGGPASSQLVGGLFNDTLFGEAGDDVLQGSYGADVLFGGAGFDTFRYVAAAESNAAAPDLIADFQTGIDKIDLRGTGVTAIGIAGNVLFGSGPGGISMQIGSINPIALSDVIIGGPAPAPVGDIAATASHDPALVFL